MASRFFGKSDEPRIPESTPDGKPPAGMRYDPPMPPNAYTDRRTYQKELAEYQAYLAALADATPPKPH